MRKRSARALRPAITPTTTPMIIVSAVARSTWARLIIVSFHRPMRTTSVSRTTERIATPRPPMIAARTAIMMTVRYHGALARTPSSGLRNVTVKYSLNVVVMNENVVVIHVATASAALATVLPKSSCSGKTAAHST